MNAKQQTTAFFDAVFSVCRAIDLAIALPSSRGDGKSALWLHPDHPAGAFLRDCDRNKAEGLRKLLHGKNMNGGSIFWRPAEHSSLGLLDDLDADDAAGLSEKYQSLIAKTSSKFQAWILCDRALSFDDRHIIQSALVNILNHNGQVRADPGATSGKQVGRVPGFFNRKPQYAPDFPLVEMIGTPFDKSKLLLKTETFLRTSPATPPVPLQSVSSGVRHPAGSPLPPPYVSSSDRNESCAEFGWACGWLSKNLSVDDGVARLADRALARGKRGNFHAAEKYARLTFDNAARRVGSVT